ncbi:MAG: hypothetical protein OXI67_09745 [Candidatus Poribacteria bacterium]|nr:hypothetical protein [Candidatus Poribacteria bacterium]
MIRDIFTNKWIIGGVLLLILGAIAFHILLERDMANFRRQVMQDRHAIQERARAAAEKETTQEVTPAEGTTPSAEKTVTAPTEQVKTVPERQTETETPQQTALPAEKADAAEVAVSAFGFGPFPKVPEGMDFEPFWADPELYPHIKGSRDSELIDRVWIKAWEEGKRDIVGASFKSEYNRVFLNYSNVVYVTWDKTVDEDGNRIRYITRLSGASSATNRVRANNIARLGGRVPTLMTEVDIPSDIEVILHSEGGIDPFEYLGLNP